MNRYSREKSVILVLFTVMQLVLALKAFSQDERLFRHMFTGELVADAKKAQPKIVVESKAHQIDMNKDGVFESLIISKRDGIDFISIRNFEGRTLFEERLDTYGKKSHLYKIEKVALSAKAEVYVLSFFDGVTKGKKFEGRARAYFVTIDNKDLKSLKLYRGPFYWQEIEKLRETYWQRPYSVSVVDFNKDGTREILVSYKSSQHIFFYKGNGKWQRF